MFLDSAGAYSYQMESEKHESCKKTYGCFDKCHKIYVVQSCDFEAFEEFDGDYSLEVPIDFEEKIEGIDSIKINGNVLSYKSNDMQDYKHLAILLMASYQENIATQIHKKLIGIK